MKNKYENSFQYLKKYDNLKNGYYEYSVNDEILELYTIFDNSSGWIKVVTVSDENNLHINNDEVPMVKQSDDVINCLMTRNFKYSVMAVAKDFNEPKNSWLQYPHKMYIHNSIEKFSSNTEALYIKNSGLVSLNKDSDPLEINQNDSSYTFGSGEGDTFFAYGSKMKTGFFQSFSGSGNGEVFVR